MPHDRKNQELHVGDTVIVPCVVKSVTPGTDFCNVTLETLEPMFPGEHKTSICVNAKQVVKVEVDG